MNWVGAVVAAVFGAALGVLFTVAHDATAWFWRAPVGLVLGLLAVAALLGALRLLWETRLPAIGAAVGLIVAVAVVASGALAGAVGAADGLLGWLWVIGADVIAVAAVLWPEPRAASETDATTMDGHPIPEGDR